MKYIIYLCNQELFRTIATCKSICAKYFEQSLLATIHLVLINLMAALLGSEDEVPYHRELIKLVDNFTCGFCCKVQSVYFEDHHLTRRSLVN